MSRTDKLEMFKISCRMYKKEKEEVDAMPTNLDKLAEKNYEYLRADVEFVDRVMEKIALGHGTNAQLLVWELYVENRTRLDVASEYHMNAKTVGVMVDKWLREALEDEF